MGVFKFKQFEVSNNLAPMKINTDGVILGAYCSVTHNINNVLDIGTGTGVIALMIAQRISQLHSDFNIKGIDIDKDAFMEAKNNFLNCKWSNCLEAYHTDLKDFKGNYDLVVSNPPFFENSLTCSTSKKTIARHTESLSYKDILCFCKDALSKDGVVSIILPYDYNIEVIRFAKSLGFNCFRFLSIYSKLGKNPHRCIMEFTKKVCPQTEDKLIINADNGYSNDYINLTKDFYLNF